MNFDNSTGRSNQSLEPHQRAATGTASLVLVEVTQGSLGLKGGEPRGSMRRGV